MTGLPSILAFGDYDRLLEFSRSAFRRSSEAFILFGALFVVVCLLVFWAAVLRPRPRRRRRQLRPVKSVAPVTPVTAQDNSVRRARRVRRPLNPTLAQTRGLPPVRETSAPSAEP